MDKEWRVVESTGHSVRKQLWVRLRSGLWVPTDKFMWDGQIPIRGGSPGVVDKQVAASFDDAFQIEQSGAMYRTHAYVEIKASTSASGRNWAGLRWTGCNIEQGMAIDVCYIEVYVYYSLYDDVGGHLHFEKGGNPVTFSSDAFDITNRTRTTASEYWSASGLVTDWRQSPSLVVPLQEVVDAFTATDIVLIGRPADTIEKRFWFYSWNHDDNSWGAKLHIEYSAAAGPRAPATGGLDPMIF